MARRSWWTAVAWLLAKMASQQASSKSYYNWNSFSMIVSKM
jgi:hypothetical protein